MVSILTLQCAAGEYDCLASSDKGSDNQGHSFEDKVVDAFTTVFSLKEIDCTAQQKRERYNTTPKAIIYAGVARDRSL